MSEKYYVYSEDRSEVLLKTEDYQKCQQFLIDSGKPELPMIVEYPDMRYAGNLDYRWTGTLGRNRRGHPTTINGRAFEVPANTPHWDTTSYLPTEMF